ncbi:MAG: AI-2E family transporter [Capnocytophaga sp.]|nr:AI-2E family transporter [Capnocytophaga sp.]
MNSKIIANGILRAIVIIVSIVLSIFIIYQLQTVITYIALAMILALIGHPMISFFKKKLKFRNTLAVLSTISIMLFVLIGIISLFIPLLRSQGENLASINFQEVNTKIHYFLENILNSIGLDGADANTFQLSNIINVQDVSNVLNGLMGFMGTLGMGLFSVVFIAFFFMKDGTKISDSLINLINVKHIEAVRSALEMIKSLLSRYFVGLLLQITIIFIMLSITLLIFGVKDAIVIAFLCALLNLIPYLGPLIGGVLICILTISNFIDADLTMVILPKTIYVLIGFLITQFVDNVFSQPIIFSNSVKSNPLEIFLVILIIGTLFGIIGMVIAVPLYTVLKVILKAFFPNNKIVKFLTPNI